MKKLIIGILILITVTSGFSQKVTKRKTIKLVKEETLTINLNTGGSIEIHGWNKNVVDLVYEVEGHNVKDVFFETKPDHKNIRVTSGFTYKKNLYGCESILKVWVPKQFHLSLYSKGGNIEIFDVDGIIEGSTKGGEIILRDLKGSIKLSTEGGNILLKDSKVNGIVYSLGGRILLKNIIGDVVGQSVGGKVIYQNVRRTHDSLEDKVIRIRSEGSNININEASSGADISTMGGNIHIKSAKKFIKAYTMGGQINLDAVDGWIDATTLGGDIKVVMCNGFEKRKRDVKLETMGGTIILYIPEEMSVDFDIELVFTKNSKNNFKIYSDLQISRKTSKVWDFSYKTPQKSIIGRSINKNGKHKIKIKNTNGNIYIKKAKKSGT